MSLNKRNTLLISSVIIFIACFVAFFPQNNKKSSGPISRIAVVDTVKLKNNALCFKAHEKTASMLSDVIDRMHKSETSLKREYEDLKNNKKLPKKQKASRMEHIESKWANLAIKYKQEVQNIKNTDLKLSDFLQKKLNEAIKKIAKEKNTDIVLNTQIKENIVVFYSSDTSDITEFVIRELNTIVPSVKLSELK